MLLQEKGEIERGRERERTRLSNPVSPPSQWFSPVASLTQHWSTGVLLTLTCPVEDFNFFAADIHTLDFLKASESWSSDLWDSRGNTEKQKTTIYFFVNSYWISALPLFSSFFLLNTECLIERLQAFIHGNKQLARLALKALVGCQHGSLREILPEEYLSQ